MAFEPAIDIGDVAIDYLAEGYISSDGGVYTDTVDIGDPEVDLAVSYLNLDPPKVFAGSLVLEDTTTTLVEKYVVGDPTEELQVYQPSDIILLSSIPQEPGDDGILIVFGVFAEWTYLINGSIVSFFDNSLGSPVAWYWDFGDGNDSTDQNPIHTYSAEGPYTVSLTATFINGNVDTSTKIIYILSVDGILFPIMGPF